eukprot:COSAG06_NODE_24384_length_664_cov_1.277876_1_plen_41_part_10
MTWSTKTLIVKFVSDGLSWSLSMRPPRARDGVLTPQVVFCA